MKSRYKMILQSLLLSTTLGLTPAYAQEHEAITIELLLELVANDAAEDVLNLSGAELAEILEVATDEQRAQLVATLSPAQVDALVAAVAASGAEPSTVAALVIAVITADPSAAQRIVEIVRQNTAPEALEQVANALVAQIESRFAELPAAVSSALVLAALALDSRAANQLVAAINRLDAVSAAALSAILATACLTADPATASAIETALAVQGGPAAQLFSAAICEVAPAPAPVAEAPPAPAPPAPIGGAGATPSGTAASSAGGQTQVATSAPSPSSGGLSPGPSVSPPSTSTPPAPPEDVSPVN